MAPSAPAFQRRFIGQSTGNKSIVIGANWRWLRRWIQSSFDPSLLFGVVEPELTSGASIIFFFYYYYFFLILFTALRKVKFPALTNPLPKNV